MDEQPVEREIELVCTLGPPVDHQGAERILRREGWTWCGAGDWAFALRSPSGGWVARISPFDPAAPFNAELYRRAAHTGLVPQLGAEVELDGGASLLLLERLDPVPPTAAAAFLADITSAATIVAELSDLLDSVHTEARRALPWCGPVDTNPTNVMRRQDGQLVLIDPFYADGPNLYATILTDPDRVAAAIAPHRRRHMFDLPLHGSGPPKPGVLDAMRAAMVAADARLGQG